MKRINVEAEQVVANTEGPTSDSTAKSNMSRDVSTGRRLVGALIGGRTGGQAPATFVNHCPVQYEWDNF